MGKRRANVMVRYVNGRVVLMANGGTAEIIDAITKGLARILIDAKKPELTPGVLADKVRGWILDEMLAYLKEKGEE